METPSGILREPGFVPVDVGPVWISELGYQLARDVPVEGMVPGTSPPAGVVGPDTADPAINNPATYSIAVLATSKTGKRRKLARQFIDFIRSPDGQGVYTKGGFIGLTDDELAGGECYSINRKTGELVTTTRENNSCK